MCARGDEYGYAPDLKMRSNDIDKTDLIFLSSSNFEMLTAKRN